MILSRKLSIFGILEGSHETVPVSYTHLDVYKRQLACCAVIALIICYGAEKLGESLKLPLWEEHGHLLKENKVQAIAILAALLFGASLALFPLPEEEHEDCCGTEDYTQVECD